MPRIDPSISHLRGESATVRLAMHQCDDHSVSRSLSPVTHVRMEKLRPIAVISLVFLVYSYAVVAAFFHELVFAERRKDEKVSE